MERGVWSVGMEVLVCLLKSHEVGFGIGFSILHVERCHHELGKEDACEVAVQAFEQRLLS